MFYFYIKLVMKVEMSFKCTSKKGFRDAVPHKTHTKPH